MNGSFSFHRGHTRICMRGGEYAFVLSLPHRLVTVTALLDKFRPRVLVAMCQRCVTQSSAYLYAISNALNRPSVHLDVPLLGHDASPTTYARSFLKKKTTHPLTPIHSFLFLSLLSAHLPTPSARLLALPSTAHGRLRVTVLNYRPCQA